jgi:hypothetical protein
MNHGYLLSAKAEKDTVTNHEYRRRMKERKEQELREQVESKMFSEWAEQEELKRLIDPSYHGH